MPADSPLGMPAFLSIKPLRPDVPLRDRFAFRLWASRPARDSMPALIDADCRVMDPALFVAGVRVRLGVEFRLSAAAPIHVRYARGQAFVVAYLRFVRYVGGPIWGES